MVHANVLEMFEVKVIFGLDPLQVDAVGVFVTFGLGFTATVMV